MSEEDHIDNIPNHWICIFCSKKNRKASGDTCVICQHAKQPSRIGIAYAGSYFLCKTNTSLKIPTVSIFRVSPLPQIQMKCIIPALGVNLKEAIIEVLESSDIMCLSSSEVNNMSVGANDVGSLLSSTSSIMRRSPFRVSKTSISETNRSIDSSKTISLYDSVIKNAKNLVYDGSFGRFIDRSNEDIKTLTSSFSPDKKSLKYAQSMIRSQLETQWDVSEEIRKSKFENELSNQQNLPSKKAILKHPCNVCEFMFPMSSLVGMVSYKAVLEWKKEHGVEVNMKDRRWGRSGIHDGAKICIFCVQFFNGNFSSVMESLAKENKHDSDLNFLNDKPALKTNFESQPRPFSRLAQSVSIAQLKVKSELSKSHYQVLHHNHYMKIIDMTKVGTLLRDKYKNDAAGIAQKKKKEISEILLKRRLERLENKIAEAKKEEELKSSLELQKNNSRRNSKTRDVTPTKSFFLTQLTPTKPSLSSAPVTKPETSMNITPNPISSRSNSSRLRYSADTRRTSISSSKQPNKSNQKRAHSSNSILGRRRPFNSSLAKNISLKPRPRARSATSISSNSTASTQSNKYKISEINRVSSSRTGFSPMRALVEKRSAQMSAKINRERYVAKALARKRKPLLIVVPDTRSGVKIVEFPVTSEYIPNILSQIPKEDSSIVENKYLNQSTTVSNNSIPDYGTEIQLSPKNELNSVDDGQIKSEILNVGTRITQCVVSDFKSHDNKSDVSIKYSAEGLSRPEISDTNEVSDFGENEHIKQNQNWSRSELTIDDKNGVAYSELKNNNIIEENLTISTAGDLSSLTVVSATEQLFKSSPKNSTKYQRSIRDIVNDSRKKSFDGSLDEFIKKHVDGEVGKSSTFIEQLSPFSNAPKNLSKFWASSANLLSVEIGDQIEIISRGASRGKSRGESRGKSRSGSRGKRRVNAGEAGSVGYIEVLTSANAHPPTFSSDVIDEYVSDESAPNQYIV